MNRCLRILFLLLCLSGVALGQTEPSGCQTCHVELDEQYAQPAILFVDDVHNQAGLTCSGCHGGNANTEDFDEAKSGNFIGKPVGKKIVEMCGKCHSDPGFMRKYNPGLPIDQVAKFWSSVHGQNLQKGGTDAANCSSCHATHGIKRANDPGSTVFHSNVAETCGTCHADKAIMSKYGHDTDIVENYLGSVHGVAVTERGDRAAPTCNNCHGNHGAAPPTVTSIQQVCGTCHVNNQQFFLSTAMSEVFADMELHGCAVCHTAHDIQKTHDEMVGLEEPGVCGQCHEDDNGAIQTMAIRAILDSVGTVYSDASQKLEEAESSGLVVHGLLLDLQNVKTSQIRARTVVHTYDSNQVREAAAEGIETAEAIIASVEALYHDFKNRKIGLGVATILISFFSLMLYLYIKSLD